MTDPEPLARALHATDPDYRGTKWEGMTEHFRERFRDRARKMIAVMESDQFNAK